MRRRRRGRSLPPRRPGPSAGSTSTRARAPRRALLASAAARRIAGALEGVVVEPPEPGREGAACRRCGPRPSRSAGRAPRPRRWRPSSGSRCRDPAAPCWTSAEPSRLIVTVARGPVSPVLYQTAEPTPTPRRIGGVRGLAALRRGRSSRSSRRRSAAPRGGPPRGRSSSGTRRIHAELRGQLVHDRLEREGALRVARRAQGARGTGVGEDVVLVDLDVRAGIDVLDRPARRRCRRSCRRCRAR